MNKWWNLVWWKSDEFEVSAETSSTFRIPKGDEKLMKKVMKSGLMKKWWKSDEIWSDEKVMNSRFQLRHPPLFASPKVMNKWWKSDEFWSDEKVMKKWWNLVWWKSYEFEVSAETSSTFRIPKGDEQVMKKWWNLVWWKSDEFELSAKTSSTFRIPKGDEKLKRWWNLVWWKSRFKSSASKLNR